MDAAAAQSASIERDGERILLKGVLDFNTVPSLAKQAGRLLAQSDNASVDCAGVSSANSAGLALLLEMSRIMRASQKPIAFHNVPPQIQSVARAYGLVEPEQKLEAIL